MEREMKADIVILGGGLGGCAAALAAAQAGHKVILTEQTDWLGGQLTSQAVPPDEHPWIEQFGCTATYRELRNRIRQYYHDNYPLTEAARSQRYLNPGNGYVSRLCHEPRVALAVIEAMLAPYRNSGRLTVLLRHKPVAADVKGDTVAAVTVCDLVTGAERVLHGEYFLDATEIGDVLPLAGVEYVTGAESQKETGELHALQGDPDPLDMQAITFCFAIDYIEGEDHTIERPRDYDFWREYYPSFWPNKLLDWTHPHPITLEPRKRCLFPHEEITPRENLWMYRRIIDKSNFAPGTYESDISLVNWPQVDYWEGPIFEVPEEEAARHLEAARQLSLSFLYWMQTEAPRPDGGMGYPGLRLRKDVVDTEDGLAKYPYIRESRRIKPVFLVTEQHVGYEAREGRPAERFYDSVGVGSYRIDLHPSTSQRNYIDISSWPFQIPLGALIPIRVENLLPACKNLGVTHITNGCYRLHPVEWNIGEAAGHLAAHCIEKKLKPREVREKQEELETFQSRLRNAGFELEWPQITPR